MGWLFSKNQSKQELIKKRLQSHENDTIKWEYISHSIKGNCLWKILKHTNKLTGEVKKVICLDLLSYQKGYGYGYKDMDETMGPCYYSVPVSWFKMVACPDAHYAKLWRENVISHNDEKKAQKAKYLKLEIGKTYSLIRASIPQITVTGKRKNTYIGVYNGSAYSLPVRMIGSEIIS